MIGWTPSPFIFVHIPKCAGTSIERALIPFTTPYRRLSEMSASDRNRHFLPGGRRLQHLKLREYARDHALKHYFKFSFVRNPWDRVISHILYAHRLDQAVRGRVNLKEHIRTYCLTTGWRGTHDFAACQVDYLLDGSGKVSMDYLGRFESLKSDFQKICGAIGLKSIPALPHRNNRRRILHYSAHYDAESVEWVGKRFARDIEYFGYQFEDRTQAKETPAHA